MTFLSRCRLVRSSYCSRFESWHPQKKRLVERLAFSVFALQDFTGFFRRWRQNDDSLLRHPEERNDEGSSYCTRQDFTGCFKALPLKMTYPFCVILNAVKDPVTVPSRLYWIPLGYAHRNDSGKRDFTRWSYAPPPLAAE